MPAATLLHDLADAGVSVEAHGGSLVVTPASRLTDEFRVALRTLKPELLALLGGAPRTCKACTHRLRAGTCAVPEQSGLIPVGSGFGIFWPPAGHAVICPAWCSKAPAATATRPYKLSQAQADAAHAEPWDDGAIARFRARAADIQRRGVGDDDAEDLAELLHLRDASGDGRHLCVECRHLLGSAATGWRCSNHRLAGMPVALAGDLVVSLAQCRGYGQPWTSPAPAHQIGPGSTNVCAEVSTYLRDTETPAGRDNRAR